MSVIPDWADAIDPKAAQALLSGDSLSKSALNAGLDAVQTQATATPSAATAQEAQASADAQIRSKINNLSDADRGIFQNAVGRTGPLIDAWNTGAQQGATAFHSGLVTDQSVFSPALAGNLMWAATSIEGVGAKVLLSFVGATAGSFAGFQSDYDKVIGPIIGDVSTHLNQLHDDMLNRADVLIYPTLMQEGLSNFAALDLPHQNILLWNGLFSSIRSDTGQYTNHTRDFVLGNLQAADREASDKLAFYRRVWPTSLVIAGSGIDGPRWMFSQERWSQQTDDPVWLWSGRDVSFDEFTGSGEDPCNDRNERNKRAAVLLRLAINRRWPVNP